MTKEEQAKYDLLEANVKAITDRLDIVDQIFAKAKMGIEMQLVFACGASGLYFPADYVRLWGKPYGDGLGPDVCSETLQSNYDVAPPEPDRNTRSMDQIMHPLFVSRAQVDAILVEVNEAKASMAILDHEDTGMYLRSPILRAKQLSNPSSKINKLANLSVSDAIWKVRKEGFK